MPNATEEFKSLAKEILSGYQSDPKEFLELLSFKAKLNLYKYSPRNTAVIHKQNPHVTFVASYDKWKRAGYSVQKGQKGMKILVPATVKYFMHTSAAGDQYWKRLYEATKAEQALIKSGQISTRTTNTFVLGHVFDISQTNCPIEDYPKYFALGHSSENHARIYEILKELAREKGISVVEGGIHSVSLRGEYFPGMDSIRINPLLQDTQKLSTFIHELSHAYLHSDSSIDLKSIPLVECEADSLSLMIHANLGLEITEAHKRHFISAYSECSRQSDFSFDELFDNISKRFVAVYEEISPAIAQALSPRNELLENPITEEKDTIMKQKTDPHIREVEQENYRLLKKLAPEILNGEASYMKFARKNHLDLSIDHLGENHISVAQNYILNGDVMAAPDMEFMYDNQKRTLQALSFQQDDLGIYHSLGSSPAIQFQLDKMASLLLSEASEHKLTQKMANVLGSTISIQFKNGHAVGFGGEEHLIAHYQENMMNTPENEAVENLSPAADMKIEMDV